MWQTLFYLPFLNMPVYGYGVMLVIGFVCAMWVAQFLARRTGLDAEAFANAAIIALVAGVVGARLSHVLENLSQYTNPNLTAWGNFENAINIRQGGLTYYGGFLLATPACIAYGLYKRVSIPMGMDIIAPCLMVGLAFGRVGCFLNGCCYGAATNVPWAVEFPYGSDAYITQFTQNQLHMAVPRELIRDHSALGEYMDEKGLKDVSEPVGLQVFNRIDGTSLKPRDQIRKEANKRIDSAGHTLSDLVKVQHADPVHPAEIYNTIIAFTIAAFLIAYFTLPHVPGHVFAVMMVIEGIFRYLLEILRVEPAVVGRGTGVLTFLPPQSYSMCVSFLLVVGGLILWPVFTRLANRGSAATPIRTVPVPA